jgi:hypothetical protein
LVAALPRWVHLWFSSAWLRPEAWPPRLAKSLATSEQVVPSRYKKG